MGQTFTAWGRHSLYGTGIHSVGQTFTLWDRHSLCGTDIHCMGQTFTLWSRHSLCGADIPSVGQIFTLWGKHSLCGADILSVGQTFPPYGRHSLRGVDIPSVGRTIDCALWGYAIYFLHQVMYVPIWVWEQWYYLQWLCNMCIDEKVHPGTSGSNHCFHIIGMYKSAYLEWLAFSKSKPSYVVI